MNRKLRSYSNKLCSSWVYAESLYKSWAESMNISFQEFAVFYALDSKEEMTQKDICDFFSIPKQTVNYVIRDLKNKGYIKMSPNENDKREKLVKFTSEGKVYVESILKPLYEIEISIFNDIGEERMLDMLKTTLLFNTLFEKKMEEIRKNESV